MGAEETEEEALLAAGGADGPEMREQPSRESSAVRGSGTGQEEPKVDREGGEVYLWFKYKEDKDT